jgi:hypothetical protein
MVAMEVADQYQRDFIGVDAVSAHCNERGSTTVYEEKTSFRPPQDTALKSPTASERISTPQKS